MSEEHIPYYYGLNYDAPGGDAAPVRPVGNALAGAYRQSALGADGGLWYEKLTGVPVDAGRFQIGFGGEDRKEAPSDWTSYHTLPESAGMILDSMFGESVRGLGRVGGALRGENTYPIDEINDPKTVARAQVKDVLDSLSLYSGPGILSGKPTQTGFSVFGGLGAKNPKVKMQQVAEVALAAGKNPDEVWTVTGWRKAADGKWRFEIDDSRAVFDYGRLEGGAGQSTLGNLLKHDNLFKQYPELADYRVRLGHPQSMGDSRGFFDSKSKTITLRSGLSAEDAKSVVMHEIQHGIQSKEGFARGGSAESKNYSKLYGESEARMVQDRMTWDADMRREVAPVDPKDAIIRFGGKMDAEQIERLLLE